MSVIVQDDLLTAGAWAACGPTSSRLAEGLAEKKKKYDKWPQEEQRAQVVNIKPWFGWARDGPHVRCNTNSRFSSKKSDIQDLYVFIYPSLIQDEKGKYLLLLHVDNLSK